MRGRLFWHTDARKLTMPRPPPPYPSPSIPAFNNWESTIAIHEVATDGRSNECPRMFDTFSCRKKKQTVVCILSYVWEWKIILPGYVQLERLWCEPMNDIVCLFDCLCYAYVCCSFQSFICVRPMVHIEKEEKKI